MEATVADLPVDPGEMALAREFVRDHGRETAFRAGYDDTVEGVASRAPMFERTAFAADYDTGRGFAVVDLRSGRPMSSATAAVLAQSVLRTVAPVASGYGYRPRHLRVGA